MSDVDRDELTKRIRSLTSLLHSFKVQKSPSKQPKDILPFLRHFTTLLTCGDRRDKQAKKVIAVTGSIDAANQVRTLVVSQNPFAESSVETISLKLVELAKKPLEEVVTRPPNASLFEHIADVWAALSAIDRISVGPARSHQLESLELFFLGRSFRKFAARFKEGKRLCGNKELYKVINEWRPDRPEITPKWVNPPRWLLNSPLFQDLKPKSVEGRENQVEFSDDTKLVWAKVLGSILLKVDNAIDQVGIAKSNTGRKAEQAVCDALRHLNTWCRTLFHFIVWDAGIVRTLLTKTNMADSINTTFMPTRRSDPDFEEDDDDTAEFRQEPDESKGQQVFRYLKTVVAWHAAVKCFCNDAALSGFLENLEIGLVEVPPSESPVLPLARIADAFFKRFSDMADSEADVLEALRKAYVDKFRGCVHAEATLMGLVNYYGTHQLTSVNRSTAVIDTQHMRNIIQPVADAGSAVIAVSKKCCWCCDWLGRHLETQFKLPGTHGIMYPWDPPAVGVGATVLQRLENVLWEELYQVVLSEVRSAGAYSRQSSTVSSPEAPSESLDSYDVEW